MFGIVLHFKTESLELTIGYFVIQKLVQTFITMETLDAALDKAMETEVDYNFAIDLDGNVYRGDTAKPERVGRMSHKESVVNT